MSRIATVGFVMIDGFLSIATVLQSSLTLAVVLLSLLGSIGITMLSGTVRSALQPSYFWEDAEGGGNLIER